MDLSIIIPAYNEGANISILIEKIKEISNSLGCRYEIIVIDGASEDNTANIARAKGVRVFRQAHPGYGGALRDGFSLATGKYIVTMDADLSHHPYIIKRLFYHRDSAHVVIASRYIPGGLANMPLARHILSVILNSFLRWGLSLPVRDISSGFRLYNAEVLKEVTVTHRDFNALVEILVLAYMNGFQIKEIPFHYQPRSKGKSHARIVKFGIGYFKTFYIMWKMRNTLVCADYDARAFDSRIPPQRYWQRKRYKIISSFVGYPRRVLDAGCGTSKILGCLPQAVGLDINFNKLRYNLSLGNPLVNADIRHLCFKDSSFDEVICSEVIEHLKKEDCIFQELKRVLKSQGVLVLGTPDYARFLWIVIEWLYKKIVPSGYGDEHISRYTRKSILEKMQSLGFELQAYEYILGCELICKFKKVS